MSKTRFRTSITIITTVNDNEQECANDENELKQYVCSYALLDEILSFLSCYNIHTSASISKVCYENVNELISIKLNIDPMIKILTNNNDATCLSLTHQEVAFYKPFLTLAPSKWSDNQNNTYIALQAMTDIIIYFILRQLVH